MKRLHRVPAQPRPRWTPRRPAAALSIVAALVLAGCQDETAVRPTDVRRYAVAKETFTAVPRAPERPAPSRLPLRYETPSGWTDRGGSGLRLATLAIGDAEDGHEVTVVQASGSLEANVARWLGQLDPSAPPESLATRAAAALAAAEAVEVADRQATIVALGADHAPAGDEQPAGEVILAGVIPIDDTASLFVKFKGPAAIARRERENFARFVSSIRWK